MNRSTPIILAIALFMEMMDANVIATSLPAIAADIGSSPIALKLAMTAYLVALAIFIPVSGWMADRFGAKNVFRWAILVFMLGSVLCAMAFSLESFVGARFFQGMGGAMMTPLARLVLIRSTPRNQLVSAMAWLTVPALIGPVMGPPVGGFLTTYFSWHWIFLINIPIGIVGIIAATLLLPLIPKLPVKRIDWRGFFLAGIAFAGVLFGLSVISLPALPPWVGIVTTIVGFVSGFLYLRHARRTEHPLLDPRLFRRPMFRAAMSGAFIFRVGMGAMPFLLPLMLQLGFGLTPFQAGLVMLFSAVGAIGAKFTARVVFARFGLRNVSLVMTVVSAGFLALNGLFVAATPFWVIGFVLFLNGFSRSTFFTGMNVMCFGDVTEEEAGMATAMYTVFTHLSMALGVAVGGGGLELLSALHPGAVSIGDFHLAFFVVAGVSLFAFVPFLLLPRDAGSDISGHGDRLARKRAEAEIAAE